MRGQRQPKQSLKFVFWSTQRLLAAAIKSKQMHLQSKTRLAVSSEAGLPSWLMGCLHLLWTRHTSKRARWKIFNIRLNGSCAQKLPLLLERPSKKHNGSFASSISCYRCILHWLFPRANIRTADLFPLFQPDVIFQSFLHTVSISLQIFQTYLTHVIHHWLDTFDFVNDVFTLCGTFEKLSSVHSRTFCCLTLKCLLMNKSKGIY